MKTKTHRSCCFSLCGIPKRLRLEKVVGWKIMAMFTMIVAGNVILVLHEDIQDVSLNENKVAEKYNVDTVAETKTIKIEAYSSKDIASISVNGRQVLEGSTANRSSTGMYVAVLNEATGAVMATRVFDVYMSKEESVTIVHFLNGISDGRIICIAVKDEASLNLKKSARNLLRSFGCVYADRLGWRDSWAMIVAKRGQHYSEVFKHAEGDAWAEAAVAQATVKLSSSSSTQCDWGNNDEARRRKALCDRYEGYGGVCHCSNPESIDIKSPPLAGNRLANIPVAVIASNRPAYLFRGLKSMLSAHGANRERFTVFIDGFFDEPAAVAGLFGVKVVHHAPVGKLSGRIAQHYKRTMTETFDMFPDANYMIILEEDLQVSPDIFSYFSQLLPIIDEDKSVYCVSAWNDQCYDHTCQDPSMLYRIEGMPGLGWLLKRSIFKEELEPIWPAAGVLFDWDMWMREDFNRKGRECIIPDVSRTYHFGAKGLNVNVFFQEIHFSRRKLNMVPNVEFNVEQMRKKNYEIEIERLISNATALDHKKDPCKDEDFFPGNVGATYVFYIDMRHARDWTTWMKVAKCLKVWDLDVRDFHNGMLRMWYRGNHLLVVGFPASLYAKYKPNELNPIHFPEKKKT